MRFPACNLGGGVDGERGQSGDETSCWLYYLQNIQPTSPVIGGIEYADRLRAGKGGG